MSFQNDRMPAHALALLDAARHYDDPTPADRARIYGTMAPKLAALGITPAVFMPAAAAAAPAATGTTAAVSAGGFGLGAKLALVLVSASVAAGGTLYGLHAHEQANAAVHASAQAASAAPAAAQRAAVANGEAPALQPATAPIEARAAELRAARVIDTRPSRPMHARFSAAHRATSHRSTPSSVITSEPAAAPEASAPVAAPIDVSLREELALIARANTALRLQRPADALRALGEHASRFQNGLLSEERRGLRVLALCALSPNQAALDARDAFLRTTPSALLAPKVRAACTKDANGTR